VTEWHLPRGQKRLWWEAVTKHLGQELSSTAKHEILEDMIGSTFDKEGPDKFAKHVLKFITGGEIEAKEMQWLMERAGQRWGSEAVNMALRGALSKDKWAAY
jgi:hypothetical protein